MMFLLGARCRGATPGSDRFKDWSSPGKQVYREDIVKLILGDDLDASAQ